MHHLIAFASPDHFAGWPANNGLWAWDNELLVGCSVGDFQAQAGHDIAGDIHNVLLRSLDGGESWAIQSPQGYSPPPPAVNSPTRPVNFCADDLAIRVIGSGYHGIDEPRGGWLVSEDRGHTWHGPYRFNGLEACESLRGLDMTPRTDYLINGAHEALFFLSARNPQVWGSDRTLVAETTDGGLTWRFVSWMVPPSDPFRAVMPCTVRGSGQRLISAVRRRDMQSQQCWIDALRSENNGASWAILSRIGETGGWNGNPPALTRLSDGRLCCVYGQRDRRCMLAQFSTDDGATWQEPIVLRRDFASVDGEPDFGYPRLVQRPDGCLIAVYYWATATHPQQHIAATIWQPTQDGF